MQPPKIGGGQLQEEVWRALQEAASAGSGGGAHVHPVSEVTDLQDALDSKASAVHNHDAVYAAIDHIHDSGAAAWGDITGTLSDQTDLQTALDAKSEFSGSYTDLTDKPTLGGAASKEVGTAAGTVAAGDHTHAGGGSALDAWPVGSVYIAVDSTSPATRFGGGTWSAFGAGRMLVGINASDADFDAAEETGGAKTVTLTAAQSGLPQHTHIQDAHSHVENSNNATTGGLRGWGAADTSTNTSTATGYSTATTTAVNQNAGPTDAAEAHSNMPPYIVVYMWKRTA